MARDWQNDATNWEAASADYPDGKIKDDSAPGAGDGTLIDEILHGDQAQFFLKLMSDAGITADGTAENETNGYQFLEALDARINENTGWLSLINGSSGATINRGHAAQQGKMITITGAITLSTITAGTTIFYISPLIAEATVDIDFIAGSAPSEGEEIISLYVDANTRAVKLRDSGNTPNTYSFCVTYPAI